MIARLSVFLLAALLLTACGGDSGGFFTNGSTSDTDSSISSDTSTSSDTDTDAEPTLLFGSKTSGVFTEGQLYIESTSLDAFDSTEIQATLQYDDGTAYTNSASVWFKSVCSEAGFASIDSITDAVNGTVTVTYTAKGCEGDDIIVASTYVDSVEYTAGGTITVASGVANSIRFDSISPSNIGIKGFGQVEEATATFTVVDQEGNALPNRTVNFALSSSTGGMSLYPTSATSDAFGAVTTVIHSGTTAASVRVIASLDEDSTITATSGSIVISTGVPDQNSFSITASTLNPNASKYNGVEVAITAMAADHFNNPVPDGTAVYFTSEGGQIDSSCETSNGSCSVTWRSSSPRPCYGRATVLATMVGEESFIDANGNGILDLGETFFDLPEAFRDDDEDGVYDDLEEEFWDFNRNGEYDTADGVYNGMLCDISDANNTQCAQTLRNIYVRDSLELVMASDTPRFQIYQDNVEITGASSIPVPLGGTFLTVALSGRLADPEPVSNYSCDPEHETEVLLQSIPSGYQPMPAGTEVAFDVDEGVIFPQPAGETISSTDLSNPTVHTFFVAPSDNMDVGATSFLTLSTKINAGDGSGTSEFFEYYILNFYEGGPVTN